MFKVLFTLLLVYQSNSAMASSSHCTSSIKCQYGTATCSSEGSADRFCGLDSPSDKWVTCQDRGVYAGNPGSSIVIDRDYICCTLSGNAKSLSGSEASKLKAECDSYGTIL